MTLREHLASAEDQGGYIPELHPDPPPELVEYIWQIFGELHSARANNGLATSALTYSEMEAWGRLTARQLTPFEVRTIKEIDNAFLKIDAGGGK